jgi:uncharacterized protein (TIGR02118 family)
MPDAMNSTGKPIARFLAMYDAPIDPDEFDRHYNDVHVPLAKQYPGLRRFTRSHQPTALMGEACYMVVTLDWDDMASMHAALESEAGNRVAEDAMKHLGRLTTFRAMLLELEEL